MNPLASAKSDIDHMMKNTTVMNDIR
jgi:hypothetical protein